PDRGASPHSLFRSFLWLRLHAAFNDRQLRSAHAEGFSDFGFDLGSEVGVLVQEAFRVLASLSDAHIAVREPRSRLLDDAVLEADVDELAGLGNSFAIGDVKLLLAERGGTLVLDHFDLHARSDDFFAFLDLRGA